MKKLLIVLGGVILVAIGYFLFVSFYHPLYADELRGTVTSIDGSTVTVQGYLIGVPEEDKKLVTVAFTVTDKTEFVKNALVITAEDIASGQGFVPKTEASPGSLADVKPGMLLNPIHAEGNLVGQEAGVATSITYQVFSNQFANETAQ
jgi:hypothetical protein